MPCCAALCRVASRRAVACCTVVRCGAVCRGLALCRGGSVEVSLACVVVRSAGRSVAGWWLRGAVRCGCLAGSVLWGSGCAARAGGSGRHPLGPVPWSRVLWRSRSLALVAVAVPSSSSGACQVALVVAGVIAWRGGRGDAPRSGLPCGFLCWCGLFSPCRCALHPPCGFWWLVGVRWCDPYGVCFLLRRCVLRGAPPGVVRLPVGVGRRLSPPLWYALPGCGSWCLPWCPFPLCLGPRSCPFLVLGWFPAPMLCLFRHPVPMGACPHLGPLCALLPECPLLSLALPLPLSFPFPVWWWRGGEGAPMAQAWWWVAWSHWRRAWGV